MQVQFTRLGSSNVLASPHASEDSRFILLPVIREMRPAAWAVFDTTAGRIVNPLNNNVGGYNDKTKAFDKLYQARNWVVKEFYRNQQVAS